MWGKHEWKCVENCVSFLTSAFKKGGPVSPPASTTDFQSDAGGTTLQSLWESS